MAITTYQDNYTRQPTANVVGFKISKPGFDATRTAGSNLIFDSSWPSLPIAFETQISAPFTASVAHGLSFPPFCMAWAYGPDNSGIGNTSMRYFLNVDKTNVYITAVLDGTEQTFWNNATKMNIKCFMLDLSQDVDYVLAPGDTFNMPYDKSYGVKVVKQGKNINSGDLRDFAVHSRAQSPLIQAVKTQDTSNAANPTVVQYTYKGNNPVWFYGYVLTSGGTYKYAPYYGQTYPLTTTDGYTAYVKPAGGDVGGTIIALRDPMFATTQTTVQY